MPFWTTDSGYSSWYCNIPPTPTQGDWVTLWNGEFSNDHDVQRRIDEEKDRELCPLFYWKELCKTDSQLQFEQQLKQAMKDLVMIPSLSYST